MLAAETTPIKWSSGSFWAVMAIPFVLSEWMPINIEIEGSPEVKVNRDELQISTRDEAGGYAYFLKKPLPLNTKELQIEWKWMIDQFPKARPFPPFKKETEDFALRVGLLISDGSFGIPLPRNFKREIRKKGHSLSYVLFYCSSQEMPQGENCGVNPFHEKIANCLKPSGRGEEKVVVNPMPDVKRSFGLSEKQISEMKIFGIWLFSDSDNSDSHSKARVKEIRILKADI